MWEGRYGNQSVPTDLKASVRSQAGLLDQDGVHRGSVLGGENMLTPQMFN